MPSDLQQRLDHYIAQEIRRIQATTYPLAERPTLTGTGLAITQAALQLLPVARFGPKFYLPLFIMAGLAHLWDFILGQLAHSELVYRKTLSEQLSLLSHRIAEQCEQAFREQIALLQQWQRTAVERVSHQIARDEIPLVL